MFCIKLGNQGGTRPSCHRAPCLLVRKTSVFAAVADMTIQFANHTSYNSTQVAALRVSRGCWTTTLPSNLPNLVAGNAKTGGRVASWRAACSTFPEPSSVPEEGFKFALRSEDRALDAIMTYGQFCIFHAFGIRIRTCGCRAQHQTVGAGEHPTGMAESIAKPGMPQPYSVETRAAKIGELNDMCKSMRAVLRNNRDDEILKLWLMLSYTEYNNTGASAIGSQNG